MKYVEALLKDSSFLYRLFHLAELEKNRAYCRHDLEHFLNTARIAWIFALEKGLSPEKEQIYLQLYCMIWAEWRNMNKKSLMRKLQQLLQGRFCAVWDMMRKKRKRSVMRLRRIGSGERFCS